MKVLLDTNILLRLSERSHVHHRPAVDSTRKLAGQGHTFTIGSQSITEFLAVATRAVPDRGLGMDQRTADAELSKVINVLEVIYDSAEVLQELRRIVVAHSVIGKSIHDAKLAAAMIVSQVSYILTFNVSDFARYPEIRALNPIEVAAA